MKKAKIFILMVLMSIILCGCAKCISTEETVEKVKVMDVYHRDEKVTVMFSAATKTAIPRTTPEINETYVEYNDMQFTIEGKDAYEKCIDKIGEYVDGKVVVKKYDDGTVRYNVTDIP